MNFHNDEWIMQHVKEHYDEALKHFSADRIIGIFYQGSGNYGLDYEDSDVDTKLIVAPTFKEIAMNQQPVSTTHIRENNEHIDFKDIRLYMQTFRKQNLNFLEILFTPYLIVNEKYQAQWNKLVEEREAIAHYSPIRSIKSMQGIAKEKYFAMEHHYPSRMDWIDKFGYDCYTDDTKFLTKSGWKKYCDIKDDEEIGTLNPITKALEFQKFYQRFCNHYNGIIYDVETYNSHFSVTPNHKIYSSPVHNINVNGHKYIDNLSNWQLDPIQDVISKSYLSKHRHLAISHNNNIDLREYDEVKITDDLLKLIGAFVSDGTVNFYDNKVRSIKIGQTNIQTDHNANFIQMMDSICDIKLNRYSYPSRHNSNQREIIWTTTDSILREKIYKWCGHKSENKHLPSFIYQLSKRQANILLDSLCLGDGSEQTSRRVYYTISKQLSEDVQILAMLSEHYAVIMGGEYGFKYKDHFTGNDSHIYQVAIKKEEYLPNCCHFKLGKNITETNYDGNIVCFSVPNAILITQKNGKIAIQGNCKQLHHLLRVKEYLIRYIGGETYADCLISNDAEHLIEVKRGAYNLADARQLADEAIKTVDAMCAEFIKTHDDKVNMSVENLLNDVQYNIMKIAVTDELKEG